MEEYYSDLQFLIERTFNLTNRRVFLLGHSMGNIVINRFLRDKVTSVSINFPFFLKWLNLEYFNLKEWQKQHLQGTINVAAPYGGATKLMQMMYKGKK
jgi:alpha-beta hydrolase superfamily lysophospholipase